MSTLKALSQRMRRFEKQIGRNANQIAKDVGKAVVKSLANNTPVDTSLAVSNWQIGQGAANLTNIPPHYPGIGGSTRVPSKTETITVGNIIISGKRPGVPLHISNGLPYISAIDIKSSRPGFVAKALFDGRQQLQKSRNKIYGKRY